MTNENNFPIPERIPFATDRESLLRIARAFSGLLRERITGGEGEHRWQDYRLPDGSNQGLSFDRVAGALLRYDVRTEESLDSFSEAPALEDVLDEFEYIFEINPPRCP